MRDFFDYSGQDDDYEVEYDAPVFVFDDEEDEGSGGGYESRGDRRGSPADRDEYVPDYVPDYVPAAEKKAKAAEKPAKAAEKPAEKPAPAKTEEKPAGSKQSKKTKSGKQKNIKLDNPAEFEPEPVVPVSKPRSDDDEFEPVFVFDEDLEEEDRYSVSPAGGTPRESVSGHDTAPDRERSASGDGGDGSSGDGGDGSSGDDFVFMPFLDIKDEPEEEEGGKVSLSFSKVKAPKKEKEFVFMPFLNDDTVTDDEDQQDSKKPFVSSKGTIIDEGLVLIPLESPEEILEEEAKENSESIGSDDSGISIVGGEQPKMSRAPQPKGTKKKSSSRGKRKGTGKRSASAPGSAAGGTPDEQFRAAMNNIDPKLLASVRKDPIQMAALEQAVRIALVQQAAQAAVEKTTGRSFGYIGNYSPANTPGAAAPAPGGKQPRKKRAQGLGNAGQVFNPLTSTASAPSEFGIDAKEAARMEAARLEANRLEAARMEAARLEAARLKEASSIKDMPSMFTPVKEAPPAPSSSAPTFTPGPNAQQDPALAAINAAQNEPVRPEDVMPDVTQDPALAHLKGTYDRPAGDVPPPPSSNASQPARSSGKISMTSPAAVRAAMRSGNSMDQIAAQNAAKAASSQASQAASAGYEGEAVESGRSGCLIWIIVMFIAFFIGLIAIAVWPALSKEISYRNADSALSDGKYIEAIDGFAALEDYKDSTGRHQEASYQYAKYLMERDYYDSALEYLVNIDPTYLDTSELIANCRYVLGKRHIDSGRYAEAYDQLYLIPKYQDAGDLAMEANYKAAEELMQEEKYDRAAMRFELFPDYKDSKDRYNECQYNYAQQLFDAGEYDLAYRTYASVGSYEDAPYYAAVCQYDSIVANGSAYTVEEMQSALNIISANANSHDDARTILDSYVYNKIKFIGRWESGTSFMTFELTDSGSTLVTHFEGYDEKTYNNVVFDKERVLTSDGTLIISITGFEPYTSAQPGSVNFHSGTTGEDLTFNRR